ncbi:hypothetical protein OCU04_010312 [Sclerotinia nivalis]|uniref:Uncharacterized protein n=1 Tax=Sclerotinia nivalis TaxID=352851 RepID=A0A9X0AEA7_9HELO|nr:hypothetical protein OCU04_010312 [Sclerotinia nivalis]
MFTVSIIRSRESYRHLVFFCRPTFSTLHPENYIEISRRESRLQPSQLDILLIFQLGLTSATYHVCLDDLDLCKDKILDWLESLNITWPSHFSAQFCWSEY